MILVLKDPNVTKILSPLIFLMYDNVWCICEYGFNHQEFSKETQLIEHI